MTLDEAIELLEITEDIDKISEKELNNKRKRAMQRWHPDTVPHADDATKSRYEKNFKNIEAAVQAIYQYRTGTYFSGQDFSQENASSGSSNSRQQESNLRSNAPVWLGNIQQKWQQIRQSGWSMHLKETILSDGFRLRDVLRADIKDDIMAVAITSLFYGFYAFVALSIPTLCLPFLLILTLPIFIIHSMLCILLVLPLSRIWMPDKLTDAAIFSCNKGLKIGDIILQIFGRFKFFRALVNWPFYFAKGMTLLVIRPLYELTGSILKDKSVGMKKRCERYLSGFPEMYIDQLLQKDPTAMSLQELRHLSDLHELCLAFR